jgi:5-methylcytosine-specific restriction endonuclease McrA
MAVSKRLPHKTKQMARAIQRDEPDGVWRCRYCRTEVLALDGLTPPWPDLPYPERDHVVPVLLGGSGVLENVVVACQGCNVRKGAQLLSELPKGWNEWRTTTLVGS